MVGRIAQFLSLNFTVKRSSRSGVGLLTMNLPRTVFRPSLLLAAALLAPTLRAATSYWDTSTAAGLQAGAGTWGTDGFWSASTAGTSLGGWTAGNVAEFQAAPNASTSITLGSAQSITGMNFVTTTVGTNAWTFSGAGISLASASVFSLGTSSVTVSSAISGSAALTVSGNSASRLILNGNNTYTGATTLQSNAVVQVGGSVAQSLFTVNSGALLTGTGAVGSASILNGGLINAATPGSVGIMTYGALSLQGGARALWDLADSSKAAGQGYDRFNVTGVLDFSGLSSGSRLQLQLVGTPTIFDSTKGAVFSLFSYGTLNLGGNASLSSLYSIDTNSLRNQAGGAVNAANFTLVNNTANKTIDLVYAAPVPEPSTYGLGLAGLALVFVGFLRRRSKPC